MTSLAQMLETELERALPAYEPRPSQLAMAEQVERALSQGRALVVEAGRREAVAP